MKFNFPEQFGVPTYESGRDRKADVNDPWIDDLKIGVNSWGYIEDLRYETAEEIVKGLADRVSRNGGLLLSLSPKADGTIPQEQKDILQDIGKWLSINGEAIYGTRPWKFHTEGDLDKMLQDNGNGHVFWRFGSCNSEDIRFTRRGNDLFAIALGWPGDGKLNIQTLNSSAGKISSLSLLGSNESLRWSQDERSLSVSLPAEKPCDFAVALKVGMEKGL